MKATLRRTLVFATVGAGALGIGVGGALVANAATSHSSPGSVTRTTVVTTTSSGTAAAHPATAAHPAATTTPSAAPSSGKHHPCPGMTSRSGTGS